MDDRKLEQVLDMWGRAPMGSEDAVARIVARAERMARTADTVRAAPPVRLWWAWGAGASVAAAAALALLWGQPAPAPVVRAPAVASADPGASFAMLYSTTAEEEMLL